MTLTLLEALRDRADRMPDEPALIGSHETLTCAALADRVVALAAALRERRMRSVVVAIDNGPDWIALDFAAQLAGATLVPLPPYFSGAQTRHVIDDSGADSLVVDSIAAAALPHLAAGPGERLDEGFDLIALPCPERPTALPAATARISYTSGTTGTPKGVCLGQDAMTSVARSLSMVLAELRVERHLCLLPLATLLENVAGVYTPVLSGAGIIVPSLAEVGFDGASSLDTDRLLDCMERHGAESVILVPQMLAAIVDCAERRGWVPSSLRVVAVGGGFVATSLLDRAERLGLPVYEGYGLTECASVVALNTPAGRRRGSVGRPLPHAAVRIDADSEIHVRGATMRGYVGEDAATDEIATGDLGYFDDDGFLHIVGRRRNVFITSYGRNVAPDWVEAELTGRPGIAQAAVFGEARPWNVAVIVPADASADASRIRKDIDSVNANLPIYARVGQWIVAQEPFTATNGLLTGNGRNRRDAIEARYACEIAAACEAPLTNTA